MKRARDVRAKANLLKIDHRMSFRPGPQVCATCRTAWPCKGWEEAEELTREAHELENAN